MTENELWLLAGRLATLLHEATHEPRGGGFDLRCTQALEDFDKAWEQERAVSKATTEPQEAE